LFQNLEDLHIIVSSSSSSLAVVLLAEKEFSNRSCLGYCDKWRPYKNRKRVRLKEFNLRYKYSSL